MNDGAKELDRLLDTPTELTDAGEVLPDHEAMTEQFEQELQLTIDDFKARARETILEVANVYISPEQLEKFPYVKRKMKEDIETLSELLYQMNSLRMTNHIVMKEMQVYGNISPRMIEVQTSNIGSQSELSVAKSQFLVAMEESYKKLRNDLDSRRTIEDVEGEEVGEGQDTVVVRGMKKITGQVMQMLQGNPIDNFQRPELGVTRNPSVDVEEGKDIPDEIKYPDEQEDNMKKIEESSKEVEQYFDGDQWD